MTTSKNIAVIGAGYWGKNLVRNFNNLDALHTIVDTTPDTIERMTKDYPEVKITPSFTEAINNPEIKAVAISTPAETHGNLIREALLAGKDVYVEKPICLSESEGEDLINTAAKLNRILMIGHLLWYHPTLLKLKELIDQGELGRIRYIYSNRLNMGKLRREENVLWSFAPHDVSVIIGLLDEMPDSVQAQGGNYLHQQISDTTVSLLSFASGVKAHIFVSWLHPFKEQKLVVVGDKQMAVFNDTAPWEEKLQLYPHSVEWSDNIPIANKAEALNVAVEEDEPLRAECAHFLKCIHSRQTPRTDGSEGLRVLKILNACQSSLETGQKTNFNQSKAEKKEWFAHETAEIDHNVQIGQGSKIWHFSHILGNCQIGTNCNIGQNVVIGPNVTIGNTCKIQNNVSVYEGVTLEDEVFCGPSMVFTNVMNPRCAIPRKNEYCKTVVRKGATLGANCTIVGGIEIGRYAFVGAGAVVTGDVPDYALVMGNPARQTGWMSRFGKKLNLPVSGEAETTCPHTGDTYQLKGKKLTHK